MTDFPLPLRAPSEPSPGATRLAPAVTAVVVTLGSTRYLPATLRAVGAQDVVPARVLVVDAGARPDEDVPRLARGAFAALGAGAPEIVELDVPGARTFGEAVRRALADVAPPSLVARPERGGMGGQPSPMDGCLPCRKVSPGRRTALPSSAGPGPWRNS